MPANLLLLPVFLMVLLTMVVWYRMLTVRVAALKTARIHPEKLKSQAARSLLPNEAHIPAENFANQFEVPVLFYALMGFLYITDSANYYFLAAALCYVALRIVHSTIALTYNRVMHRFSSYIASCIVLWGMWIAFGISLYTR